MKKLRKDDHCLNCGLHLAPLYNYCPQCGQENTNNKQSLKELLKDVYDDYITFDARFWRSFKPFVFSPGLLTKEFNQGHRIRYVHPVRLYLIVSLFYFFTFTQVFEIENIPTESLKVTDNGVNLDVDGLTDSLAKDSVLRKEIAPAIQQIDSIPNKKLKSTIKKRLAKVKIPITVDSLQKDSVDSFIADVDSTSMKWKKFLVWVQDKKMKETVLLDSMGVKDRSETTLKAARQLQKIGRNDLGIFLQSTIDNIPLMMIFLLPFMAVFLKIFYIRSKTFYIEHLVFAFHLQSFVYFILIFAFVALYLFNYQYKLDIAQWTSLAIMLYVVAAFKNVYQQNIVKTVIKSFLLSLTYFSVLLIFLSIELIISFWFF
jgi:hypothetical protein